MAVQKSFSLNPTRRSGGVTSGTNLERGLNIVRNLPAMARNPPVCPSVSSKIKGELINFALWLKREKHLEDSTILKKLNCLRHLMRYNDDLYDSEKVHDFILSKDCSNGVKNNLGYAYEDYLKFKGLPFKWKQLNYESPLPFVPLEKDIEQLISGFNRKYASYLTLLKETGCSPLEGYRLTPKNFNLDKQSVQINRPVKQHNVGEYKMSDRLTSMITSFVRNAKPNEVIWKASYKQMRNYFYERRNKISENLQNPNIRRIQLKTFRHFKGTMEYHKTKDILRVKEVLRHKRIESTMVYTHLVQFESKDFTCKVAKTLEEIVQLVEQGFEKVTEYNGMQVFRKRK